MQQDPSRIPQRLHHGSVRTHGEGLSRTGAETVRRDGNACWCSAGGGREWCTKQKLDATQPHIVYVGQSGVVNLSVTCAQCKSQIMPVNATLPSVCCICQVTQVLPRIQCPNHCPMTASDCYPAAACGSQCYDAAVRVRVQDS
jgi:hypothetical protein